MTDSNSSPATNPARTKRTMRFAADLTSYYIVWGLTFFALTRAADTLGLGTALALATVLAALITGLMIIRKRQRRRAGEHLGSPQ